MTFRKKKVLRLEGEAALAVRQQREDQQGVRRHEPAAHQRHEAGVAHEHHGAGAAHREGAVLEEEGEVLE
mgnify:CR=1 FL=1